MVQEGERQEGKRGNAFSLSLCKMINKETKGLLAKDRQQVQTSLGVPSEVVQKGSSAPHMQCPRVFSSCLLMVSKGVYHSGKAISFRK